MIFSKNGITYLSSGKKAAIVVDNSATGVSAPTAKSDFSDPAINDTTSTEWACWGPTNDLPNKTFANYLENTGVLASGIDIIARIAIGRGPMPVRVLETDAAGNEKIEIINDEEISLWARRNNLKTFAYETILDALKTGLSVTQLLSNRSFDRINRIKRTDASLCRFAKRDKQGAIKKIYISYEWGKAASSSSSEYVSHVRLLDRSNPMMDLVDDTGKIGKLPAEFAISSQYQLFSRQYYPMPLWWAVRKWGDIAMGVPEMKAQMFNNQMTIKYVIEIADGYWEARFPKFREMSPEQQEAKREDVLKEFDHWLAGNENAYKSLIVPTKLSIQTGENVPLIKVIPLDDLIKEGKLLPDSAAANSEILFALALNPALLGVDMPGGMYGGGKGGSNIREAFLVQILIREPEREFVTKPLNVVSEVNGWTKKYPGMEWRFPNHYLTTLDSGKNAKPIV